MLIEIEPQYGNVIGIEIESIVHVTDDAGDALTHRLQASTIILIDQELSVRFREALTMGDPVPGMGVRRIEMNP
jgi:hypothetical protein